MRLLILCERVGALGGMERYLQIVLPALAQRAEVRVIARRDIEWADEHAQPDARAAAMLQARIAAYRPDCIVAHNILDAAIARLASVHHLHDHRPFCPNGDRVYPQGRRNCTVRMGGACAWHALVHGCAYGPRPATLALIGRRKAVRDAIAAARAVIVLSAYMRDVALRNGCDRARTFHVAAPLSDDAYADQPAPFPQAPSVLFAGRVMDVKGLRSLVGALGRIEAAARPLLLVAGEGPELQAAREDAQRLGVSVQCLGAVAPERVRAAIDAATLVAVPSLWNEPFGLIGIEAQARGRPVVAYDVGGVREWLDGAGEAVVRGDEAGLARAIVAFTSDPQRWRNAGQAGLENARRFTLAAHVEELMRLYRRPAA